MINQQTPLSTGTLVMAASSLGLNADIPQRSLEAVRTGDLLIFEEDRPARQVLKTAGIHKEYLKYSEHGQEDTLTAAREALKAGKTVVYMSDQGSPVIEDPGSRLLALAESLNAKIKVIPGPCSITAALSACSFAGHEYFFAGFLPRESQDRQKRLKELKQMNVAVVIMDTPYRMKALLADAVTVYGKDRKALLAIDISGENEDFVSGNLTKIASRAEQVTEKLNFVLVLSGK